MSVYENQEHSVFAQRDYLLEAAREECRLLCPVARAEAYQVAVLIIKDGVNVELVRADFGDVMGPCEGPTEVAVCGAEEGKPTYDCNHPIIESGGSIHALLKNLL